MVRSAAPAGFAGIPGWLASEQLAGFNRNPRPISSESALSNFVRTFHWIAGLSAQRFRDAVLRRPALLRAQFGVLA